MSEVLALKITLDELEKVDVQEIRELVNEDEKQDS
jgi:hypothetical protein